MGLPTDTNIYGYNASKAASIVFTVLNFSLLIYHTYLSLWLPCRWSHSPLRYKHRYSICLFVATCFSTAGYAIRTASISSPSDVGLYASAQSYIVLSPIFVCASLYWQLKHLVLLLLPKEGGKQKLYGVSPLWFGRLFIASDITSFLTQGAGSGIASSGSWEGNVLTIGLNIILTGLALQLATFSLYLVFLGTLVVRARRTGGFAVHSSSGQGAKKVLIGVWIASVCVQVSPFYFFSSFPYIIEHGLTMYSDCRHVRSFAWSNLRWVSTAILFKMNGCSMSARAYRCSSPYRSLHGGILLSISNPNAILKAVREIQRRAKVLSCR